MVAGSGREVCWITGMLPFGLKVSISKLITSHWGILGEKSYQKVWNQTTFVGTGLALILGTSS